MQYPKKITYGFVLTTIIVAICMQFVDRRLALFIIKYVIGNAGWQFIISDIPDTLLLIVCTATIIGCIGYIYRIKNFINDNITEFYRHVMYLMPISYVTKTLFKFIFGGIATREWLINRSSYGFHWFKGTGAYVGFPSGHMLVFTALAMLLRRFYPRYKLFYTIFLLALAVSLIVTDYHFMSDVVAGAYLGIVIEICVNNMLSRRASTS